MRPYLATILSLLVAFSLAIPVTKASSPGRWIKITNLKDGHVTQIAKFAVKAHNGDYFIPEYELKLLSVDAGAYWPDFGNTGGRGTFGSTITRYQLVVSVVAGVENAFKGQYVAVVDEESRQSQDKKLVSFRLYRK